MPRLDAIAYRLLSWCTVLLVAGGIFGAPNWLLIAAGIVWLPCFAVLVVISWLQEQDMRKSAQGRGVDVDEGGR